MLKRVARPKSPDGKRVPMSTRFSEPEADAIDAARGGTDRSEWLRTAALAFLAADGRTPARKPSGKHGGQTAPARAPIPPVSTKLPAAPPAPVRPATACLHRLPAGAWCKTCGRTKT
jgi:hypothetical protein